MIVEFSVKNFRSIKELQTISFAATGLTSLDPEVDVNNIAEEGDKRLLKTVGIYGANASGKSNIIRAFEYFLQAIKNEPSSESRLMNLCDPFLYQEYFEDVVSYFQMIFILKGKKYRYGFTVKHGDYYEKEFDSLTSDFIIVNEWLYGTKDKNMVEYFIRKSIDDISKDKMPNSEKIPPLPYEHTLFLTHAAAYDSEGECVSIRQHIKNWTISNFTLGIESFRQNTLLLLEKENKKSEFLELLSSFNLEYTDIKIERDTNKSDQTLSVAHDKIFLEKSFKNELNELIPIRLNLAYNESEGTKKLFDLAGLLLRAFNLPFSAFILLDEIDSNFHPSLLIKLIGLFNNPRINKSNSQLLFTSHDTNLLSPSIMRRDQFYFVEKKEDNSSRLYSLADLKGIRKDADFAKQYLAGFYGALPILSDYLTEKTSQND